jgi:succinate dehydrogenase / fumarate reductase membrane anchor subunit
MSSLETPLHKVRGLGAAHSGTGHFWRQRITAVALLPLGLWFAYTVLGLAGTSVVSALAYFAHPVNAILMGAFAGTLIYHMNLGLQVVIDDYVHSIGMKMALLLLLRFVWIATLVTCWFSLVRIASV